MASKITTVSIVCSAVCLSIDQRKYQSSMSLASVRGIHRVAVDSPHKGSVTWKMFPFDDIILSEGSAHHNNVTWASWHLRLLAIELLVQQLDQTNKKENIKLSIIDPYYYWPFVRRSSHDWWIPLTQRPGNMESIPMLWHYVINLSQGEWGRQRMSVTLYVDLPDIKCIIFVAKTHVMTLCH